LFTAIEDGVVSPPAPSGDGGGGGGGAAEIPPEVIEGKSYLLNVNVDILSKYLEVIPGDEVAAEIIISDFS